MTMCAGCVMAAAAGASGVRSWLQAQHLSWLTPQRLRAATVGLFVAAFGFASLTISGSTAATPRHAAPHVSQVAKR